MIYPRRELGLNGRWSDPSSAPGWDSVVVTTRPADFNTINVADAEAWFRVRLVSPWPEAPKAPRRTTTLRGRIVDDSTGCGVYFCQVVVDDTQCSAYTDTLGSFVLEGVPVGGIGVDACAGGGIGKHVKASVPGDSLIVIRLQGLPRYRFARSCR